MRTALFWQSRGYYFNPMTTDNFENKFIKESYFLFNQVGAQIYIISKSKICNRSLSSIDKYTTHKNQKHENS
jgi:hypothetical protein